jgi:hypothetical protein
LNDIEYSTDCLNFHSCGAIGYGESRLGICRCGTRGIRIGVGLPIVSVRMAMMLWKFPVFRMPPFHQPS